MKRLLVSTFLLAACGSPVEEDQSLGGRHVIKGLETRIGCDHQLSYEADYPSFDAGDGPTVSFELCSPPEALHQIKGWFVSGGESYCFAYPEKPSRAPINPAQFRRCADSFVFQLPSSSLTRFYFRGVNQAGEVVVRGASNLEKVGNGADIELPLIP